MAETPVDVTRQAASNIGVSGSDMKKKLKEAVEKALKADNTSSMSIAAAIKQVINDNPNTRPKTDAERERLERETKTIGDALIGMKNKDRNPDAAIKAFNEGIDRAEGGIPMGIAVGGAAGLAAAVATDIGDWKSFGGIMTKLSLIAAGVSMGILVNNDYALRDRALDAVGMKPAPPLFSR